MLVLGVESSCDETGLALFDTEKGLLGHALHSQIAMHEEYGGVVPELASRDHIRRAIPLLREVLSKANVAPAAIDTIAYTQGPGLAGALLVGASVACGLALALDKPVLGVHHLEGHLLSPLLSANPPEFPFIALLVSGGHTQLMRVDGVGQYLLLGETLDDAAGEAFDKSAKLLGLPYPGGPAISRLAEFGNPDAYQLPRPMLHAKNLNFSFSGLKTATLRALQAAVGGDFRTPSSDLPKLLTEQQRNDMSASFQRVACETLASKLRQAYDEFHPASVVIAGGVAASSRLRQEVSRQLPVALTYAPISYCTDNAAMIASMGYFLAEAGLTTDPYELHADPSLAI